MNNKIDTPVLSTLNHAFSQNCIENPDVSYSHDRTNIVIRFGVGPSATRLLIPNAKCDSANASLSGQKQTESTHHINANVPEALINALRKTHPARYGRIEATENTDNYKNDINIIHMPDNRHLKMIDLPVRPDDMPGRQASRIHYHEKHLFLVYTPPVNNMSSLKIGRTTLFWIDGTLSHMSESDLPGDTAHRLWSRALDACPGENIENAILIMTAAYLNHASLWMNRTNPKKKPQARPSKPAHKPNKHQKHHKNR